MWAIIAAFVPGGRRPQASAASGSTREADEKENADAAPDGARRPDHAESAPRTGLEAKVDRDRQTSRSSPRAADAFTCDARH
jgi:hypothetical protein